MSTTNIFIGLGVFLLILIILMLTGRKSVHHEIEIGDSPEAVWKVLSDIESYSHWNPVINVKEGILIEGENVLYQFTQSSDKQYDILAKVKSLKKNHLLNQVGGTLGVITFDHKYLLEKTETGTRVIIHEDYSGIGVHFWDPSPLEEVYGKLNKALKGRVEKLSDETE